VRIAATLLFASLAAVAMAHPAPNSIMRLEFGTGVVRAEYWVPESELDYARAADPVGDFPAYLLRHVAAESPRGAPWRVSVEAFRQMTYLEHGYLVATLMFTPPAGASAGDFVLVDDAVTHEVRNHVVYVVTRHGTESGLAGALQYPQRRLDVAKR